MAQMENARPGAGSGPGAETAGEHVTATLLDSADITADAVPGWIRRRGGDPVVIRRRIAALFDELLGIERAAVDVPDDVDWYHVTGLNLDVQQREAVAPAPIGCAG